MDIVDQMLAGERIMLAKVITKIERQDATVPEIMRRVYPRAGRAYTIGVTGPPGAGKSTVVDKLVLFLRQRGFTVGVVAVDPTSPFSGGAVLGDRIRMQQHCLDSGVFIRSMATRGSLGGLAAATRDAITVMDAFGKDIVIVETVGVGQSELDIINRADTTLVVLLPGTGDTVQTMKAGLMEIADIFVVNKADRPGAEAMVNELESMLCLRKETNGWVPPVLPTQAHNNVGIEQLLDSVQLHRDYLENTGDLARRRVARRRMDFLAAIEEVTKRAVQKQLEREGKLSSIVQRIELGELDPHSGVIEAFGTLGFFTTDEVTAQAS